MTATVLAFTADHLRSKFLNGLSAQDRATVLSAGTSKVVRAGAVLAYQGDPADHIGLIVKGCAQHVYMTSQGRKVGLYWLPPGEVFGGAALLQIPYRYLVSTEALRDTRVLLWPRDTIRRLATQFPRLLDNALEVASDLFTWHIAAHLSLVCDDARDRLAQVLISVADCIGQQDRDGVQVEITNEQLANAANVTIFTASRLLSEWHRQGALRKNRGRIVLCDRDRLFAPMNPV